MQKEESDSESRHCPTCGIRLDENTPAQPCPVCLLRLSLELDRNDVTDESQEDDKLSFEARSPLSQPGPACREFAHFRVEIRKDGSLFELGRGAMGVTYRAIDTNLQRVVALKVISSQYANDDSTRQRFVREARAAASLRHENIASVYHLGPTGPGYFYAMEFVQGETLEEVIRSRGVLSQKLALAISCQVAAALAAANQQRIVHRDIKPANLMISFDASDRPLVKVIDFGLVKTLTIASTDPAGSTPGAFFGTLRYASPEQIHQGYADIRSDIYSLGITLWEMLAGEVPFDGTPGEIADQHLHAPLPLANVRQLTRPIVSLLCNMLEKDPARRPQTPEELLAIIRAVGTEFADSKGRVSLAKRTYSLIPPRVLVSPRTLVLGGAVLAAIVAISFYLVALQSSTPSIDPKSVAVLPFDNVGDNQNEYFSDGLTNEVIFQLSKIADLRVISRSSVLRYKAVPGAFRKNLREIGAELQVATILESSVQRLGGRVKIVTILYDLRSNRRLWGDSYDREIKDLFAIQSDVAQKIAEALQVRLSADERATIERRPTNNLTAYDLYLRGVALLLRLHEDDNEKAIALFRQALEVDPMFALAYTGVADAYIERATRFGGAALWLDSAIELCQRAISLDPAQGRSYVVLARAYFYKNLWDKAREELRKALELIPNDEAANILAAELLVETGQFGDLYEATRKCYALNPNDPYEPYNLGLICAVVGDYGLMEKWMERAINLEADSDGHDPDRRRMLECHRLIFRRNFSEALIALKQLPLQAFAYQNRAIELVVACSERLGDWRTVSQLANSELEKGKEEQWASCHLALALRVSGEDSAARMKMERVVELAREQLALNSKDFFAHWYLALGSRFLGRNEEAYSNLRVVFPGILVCVPLMQYESFFDMFLPDGEFHKMFSELLKQIEIDRERIRALEKTF
jgi:serine/threonine protein kinase/Tfp pilus assembly protein PilF